MAATVDTEKQRRTAGNLAGKYVYQFFLAALDDIYSNAANPDVCTLSAQNGYDTFANLVAIRPLKGVKRPLVVTNDAKTVLAVAFAAIADAIGGGLPAANVCGFVMNSGADCDSSFQCVRLMISAVEAFRPQIIAGGLSREFDSVKCFRTQLAVSVRPKEAHGADELARLYVNFLKCVAWASANFAVDRKTSLNGWMLLGIIRIFGALPGAKLDKALMERFATGLESAKEVAAARRNEAALKAAAKPKAAKPKAAKPKAAPKATPEATPKAAPEAATGVAVAQKNASTRTAALKAAAVTGSVAPRNASTGTAAALTAAPTATNLPETGFGYKNLFDLSGLY